ncbi:hypothetical protein [Paracidovorax citrulli]
MITVTQSERLYAMATRRWPTMRLVQRFAGCRQARAAGAADCCLQRPRQTPRATLRSTYNAGMNKPAAPDPHGRRVTRRFAWWVAFAALAGFLLAEAT